MATGLEVVGGIAAVAQLALHTKKVISKFGTLQNAPRQIERLQRIVDDLNDTQLYELAEPKERKRIEELILGATDMLKTSTKGPRPNILVEFFWPEDVEENLRQYNNEIREELSCIERRIDRQSWLGSPRSSMINSLTFNIANPQPDAGPSSHVAPARATVSSEPVYQEPRSLGRRATTFGEDRQRLPKVKLRATLELQLIDGKKAVGPFELKYLTIMERDESTRLIMYERTTDKNRLHVTHRIPRSCLRFEDDKMDDLKVCFLDPHPITIVGSGQGYEVYLLRPTYLFQTVEDREEFLVRMLERTFLGRFYAEAIFYRDEVVAQDKVVRFWRKLVEDSSGNTRFQTTVSFLGRHELQHEWSLVDFRRSPALDRNKVHLSDPGGPVVAVFQFEEHQMPKEKSRNKRFSFNPKKDTSLPPSTQSWEKLPKGSKTGASDLQKSEAQRFKEAFEGFHPATAYFTPLPEIKEAEAVRVSEDR